MNEDCVICQIIAETISARIVYRDEHVIAFFPLELNAKGHIVLASLAHYENIFDISGEALSSLTASAQLLAKHIRCQLGADGINLLHASGKAAQQSVPHFHIHLLPRFKDDSLDACPNLPEWKGDLDELLLKLKVTGKCK